MSTPKKKSLGSEPVRAQHKSAAFGSSAGLKALKKTAVQETEKSPAEAVTPKPARTIPVSTSETETPVTVDDAQEIREKPAVRTSPATSAPEPAPSNATGSETVSLWLPSTLRDAFKARATFEKRSHPVLAMTAIEYAFPKLSELLADEVAGQAPEPSIHLFERPAPRSLPTKSDVQHVTFQFRVSTKNLSVIDSLVDQFAAPSRNKLICTAITYYLESMGEKL